MDGRYSNTSSHIYFTVRIRGFWHWTTSPTQLLSEDEALREAEYRRNYLDEFRSAMERHEVPVGFADTQIGPDPIDVVDADDGDGGSPTKRTCQAKKVPGHRRMEGVGSARSSGAEDLVVGKAEEVSHASLPRPLGVAEGLGLGVGAVPLQPPAPLAGMQLQQQPPLLDQAAFSAMVQSSLFAV